MKKKGTVTKPKRKFHIWGHIANSNIEFNEFLWAHSEAQAKLIIHRRLQARHPKMVIFLEYRGSKDITPRQRLSSMLPEIDANYPCNEGCGGGPEPVLESSKEPKQRPFRLSVRDCNQRLF